MRRAFLVVISVATVVALWIVFASNEESTPISTDSRLADPVASTRPEASQNVDSQLRELATPGEPNPSSSRTETRSIQGRVVDDRAVPLSGVSIDIVAAQPGRDSPSLTRSDERGEFTLPTMGAGPAVIRASKQGFAAQILRATTTENALIVMQPSSRMEFLVVDDSDRPIADARVSIRTDELAEDRLLGSTDLSGRLDCEVPTCAATLLIHCADGRGVRESGFLLAPGSKNERRIRLPAEPTIRVSVVDENRNPLPSVRFEFPGPDGWTPLESRSQVLDGVLLHEFFAPVVQFVRISAPSRASRIEHFDPIGRTESFTEIQLEPEAIVRLSARVEGKPARVTVEVSRQPLLDISDRFQTDPSGYVELRGVPLDVAVQLELTDPTRHAIRKTMIRVPRTLQPRILDLGEIEVSASTQRPVLRCTVRDDRDAPLSEAWARWLVTSLDRSDVEASGEFGEIHTSDEQGALEIPSPHRSRRLAIGKSGFAMQTFLVNEDQSELPMVVRLERESITRGVVVDEAGQPVPAAIVESYRGREPEICASATTDTEGKFELRGLPSTGVALRARKTGHVPSGLLETISLSTPNRLELTRLGALQLELQRPADALQAPSTAPSSWSIALTRDGITTTQDTLPGKSTSWFRLLPAGSYAIRIDSPSNGTALVAAVVNPNATTRVVAAAEPSIRRTLQFVDTHGQLLLAKRVTIRSADPERSKIDLVDEIPSDDGSLSISLPRGSFVVMIRTAEGTSDERTATLDLREDSPEIIRLSARHPDR